METQTKPEIKQWCHNGKFTPTEYIIWSIDVEQNHILLEKANTGNTSSVQFTQI